MHKNFFFLRICRSNASQQIGFTMFSHVVQLQDLQNVANQVSQPEALSESKSGLQLVDMPVETSQLLWTAAPDGLQGFLMHWDGFGWWYMGYCFWQFRSTEAWPYSSWPNACGFWPTSCFDPALVGCNPIINGLNSVCHIVMFIQIKCHGVEVLSEQHHLDFLVLLFPGLYQLLHHWVFFVKKKIMPKLSRGN